MNTTASGLLEGLSLGDPKSIARCISLVENDTAAGGELLQQLKINRNIPIIGITGPPGAGKSTIINELVKYLAADKKKIAIIAVDPSSPFNFGALLGDRIRMNDLFGYENIFIRSLATRGSLGGLSEKIIEISDVLRAADFDLIIIETVGVGQSEVEIAGLADSTVVVLVPEAGDEIQTMKAGVMEIADIFIVNKADRDGADTFIKNLNLMLHGRSNSPWNPPVIKMIASQSTGVAELAEALQNHQAYQKRSERQEYLLFEKSIKLIQSYRMKSVDKMALRNAIRENLQSNPHFNIYQFIQHWL